MTLLDRIAECNDWQDGDSLPFVVDGQTVGRVRSDLLPLLPELDGAATALRVHDGALRLSPQLSDAAARSAVLAQVATQLAARGRTLPLTGELYPVSSRFGGPALLALDRAALPAFGVRAHGVHLNGFVRRPDGLHLWIARRSLSRSTYPGRLDNMVAGGQPQGLSVFANLLKECAEEASIPAELASRAVSTGAVSYRHAHPFGLKDDVLFLFELELPAQFVPRPNDGEVDGFELMPAERALQVAAESQAFKFNCPLALIDFGLRHGLLGPERDDYLQLVSGLHR